MRGRRLISTIALLGLLAPAGPVPAQTPESLPSLSVDELIVRALADNPELRAARAEIDAAMGRLRQPGLRPNPMLWLGGQKALSPDNNLTIGLTVPLDLNGRKEGRIGVAERALQLKRAQVRDRERRRPAGVRITPGEALAARGHPRRPAARLTVPPPA